MIVLGRQLAVLMFALLALMPASVSAQSQFSPELQVGNTVVTRYQIDQRARFLALIGASGDVRGIAREQLINEAIQVSAARDAEFEPTPELVEAGMAEFAGRANLETEQLIQLLGQAGIEPQTFRDFIAAGVAWRELIRARFSDAARASIPRVQLSRTLAQTGTEGGLRVLVSEILLPATTQETTLASRTRAAELSQITDEDAFSAAARQFSVANSSANGGRLAWTALESLPEEVRGIIGALVPGQTSRPVELGNAIGVFHLREVEQVEAGATDSLLVDYALFIVGGGPVEAARVAGRVDVCDDLYGAAIGLPEDRLIRETASLPEIPADIRAELAVLDENEASTALTRGGSATVLMLCERRPGLENTVDLDIVGTRLLNIRLTTTAAHFLAELRADAVVIDLTAN